MKIALDSGAYKVRRNGQRIDLDAYCQFIHGHPLITLYVNVDEINVRDPDESAARSYRNWRRMRARGAHPMPVYHVREHPDWLRRYLDHGCDTIGLAASSSRGETDAFYQLCFDLIAQHGRDIRTHAFGDSVRARLRRYPFSSADGSSWILHSMRYAHPVAVPRFLRPDSDPNRALAARTYEQAHRYARLEREVRDVRPDFVYYLGFVPVNRWQLAAFHVVGHQHALASFHGLSATSIRVLKQLLTRPQDAVAYYGDKLPLLQEMRERYHQQ